MSEHLRALQVNLTKSGTYDVRVDSASPEADVYPWHGFQPHNGVEVGPARIEPLERRALMSATVELPVAAGDTATFTLIRDGDIADVYAGAVESGNFVTSVWIFDTQPLVIASPDATAIVVVDPSEGNPLPGGLTVAAGTVTINQDLGVAGAPVAVTVDTGAAVTFGAAEHLDGLTIQSGGAVAVQPDSGLVLTTTTLAVAGTLDLSDNSLVATAPTPAGLATIEQQINVGQTLSDTAGDQVASGIYSATFENLELTDDGQLFAAPVGAKAAGNPAAGNPAGTDQKNASGQFKFSGPGVVYESPEGGHPGLVKISVPKPGNPVRIRIEYIKTTPPPPGAPAGTPPTVEQKVYEPNPIQPGNDSGIDLRAPGIEIKRITVLPSGAAGTPNISGTVTIE